MGLFDTVEVELPLPPHNKVLAKKEWQTKDLGCTMSHYKIDKNGKLWKYNPKPDTIEWELRYENKRSPKSFKRKYFAYNFTGQICFYTDTIKTTLNPDGWLEYKALIYNGKVKEIHQLISKWPNIFNVSCVENLYEN